MIPPIIRLIYYMLLNRGKIDAGCANLRGLLLPITINDAQKTIEALCNHLAIISKNYDIKVNTITTKNFTHFYREQVLPAKPQRIFKPISVTHNMTGPFRRVK